MSNDNKQSRETPQPDMPPAGPHARPELTNPDATPGAGYLPDPETPQEDKPDEAD